MPEDLQGVVDPEEKEEAPSTAKDYFYYFLQEEKDVLASELGPKLTEWMDRLQEETVTQVDERRGKARGLFSVLRRRPDWMMGSGVKEKVTKKLDEIGKKSGKARAQSEVGESFQEFMIETAMQERMKPGFGEPRSQDYTRGVMACFVRFLAQKGVPEIQFIHGDMNYLKQSNYISTEFADANFLVIAYAFRRMTEQGDGVLFLPNVGGGDDFISIFVNADPQQLQELSGSLNGMIKKEVPNLEALTGEVFGRKLEFAGTGEEKIVTPEQIANFKQAAAQDDRVDLERIFPPSAVCVVKNFSLEPLIRQMDGVRHTVDPFFAAVEETHHQIEEKKKKLGIKRTQEEPLIADRDMENGVGK